MSQEELAAKSGVSRDVIGRLERDVIASVRRSTATSLLSGLESGGPLNASEMSSFLRLFDLEGTAAVARQIFAQPSIQQTMSLRAAMEHMRPEEQSLVRRLLELIDLHGAEAVARMLDAVGSLVGVQPTVRVVSPPVQREGYTEQIITEYARPKPEPKEAQRRKRG